MTNLLSRLLLSSLILISTISFAEEAKRMRVVYKIIDYVPVSKIDNLHGTVVQEQEPSEYVHLRSNSGQSDVLRRGVEEGLSVMSYDTKYESKIKTLDDFFQAEEPYRIELQTLDAKLRQYLKKQPITFVNDQEEVTLEVMIGSLLFDSLQGYFIDDVGYRLTRNGQELSHGVFRQETNCSRLTTLLYGKCSGGYIGKFLAKDIYSKIKLFK
ncbi:MAG: hypothetical protein AB7S78_03765 [Candidatus Omnitrophota bacterium]